MDFHCLNNHHQQTFKPCSIFGQCRVSESRLRCCIQTLILLQRKNASQTLSPDPFSFLHSAPLSGPSSQISFKDWLFQRKKLTPDPKLLPGTEDGAADTDVGGAFLDGQFEVVRHAGGEFDHLV